ncbi:phage head closure protein [Xanthobacter autotrophicus]|uniref:phage head closure protein n=1 Tax=Xanthobacter autotrophicus TaxID=280 RepID=UPI00372AF13F
MRAGTLDRMITIQRATEARDDFGEVSTTWAEVATLRAALFQASTTEFLQGAGLQGDAVVIFRTRFLAGVTVRDRVLFEGVAHDIKEVKELGRRKGLEIRTVAGGVQ